MIAEAITWRDALRWTGIIVPLVGIARDADFDFLVGGGVDDHDLLAVIGWVRAEGEAADIAAL